jgi:C1A family cysteine protease
LKRSPWLVVALLLTAIPAWGQSWYGLRENGLEPPYRNQGFYGTCWAFGTMASVETNMIKEGLLPQSTAGLSAGDLAWYSGFSPIDPLNGGGNYQMSAAYFARGDGPLTSAQAPYPRRLGSPRPVAPYYVRDIEWYHNTADIKTAILNYGAVATCWAYDKGSWYGPSGYWERSSTYQATSAGSGQPNHSVAIVGWDDDWVTAGGTGAWLIRNSWGTETQHIGISYDDYYAGHDYDNTGAQNMGAVSFHNVVVNNFQTIYYHNDLGWAGQKNYRYAFNHFTASQDGLLKAASFYTTEDNVSYQVKIYKQFQDGHLGEEQVSAETSGMMRYEGFHTVDLADLVRLAAGEDFYIELSVSNDWQANDGNVNITTVTEAGGGEGTLVMTTALAGESFCSADGTTWTDLYSLDATHSENFAINGLTICVPEPSSLAAMASLAAAFALGYAFLRRY